MRRHLVVAAVACTLVLAGCGWLTDATPKPSPKPPEPAQPTLTQVKITSLNVGPGTQASGRSLAIKYAIWLSQGALSVPQIICTFTTPAGAVMPLGTFVPISQGQAEWTAGEDLLVFNVLGPSGIAVPGAYLATCTSTDTFGSTATSPFTVRDAGETASATPPAASPAAATLAPVRFLVTTKGTRTHHTAEGLSCSGPVDIEVSVMPDGSAYVHSVGPGFDSYQPSCVSGKLKENWQLDGTGRDGAIVFSGCNGDPGFSARGDFRYGDGAVWGQGSCEYPPGTPGVYRVTISVP